MIFCVLVRVQFRLQWATSIPDPEEEDSILNGAQGGFRE